MKIIEVHLNGNVTDLKPRSIPDAHDKAKQLLKRDSDFVDIYLVNKEHVLTIKKQAHEC